MEQVLDENRSARNDPEPAALVADEVGRNRTASRGPAEGPRAKWTSEGTCARPYGQPRVCNSCNVDERHVRGSLEPTHHSGRGPHAAALVRQPLESVGLEGAHPRPREPILRENSAMLRQSISNGSPISRVISPRALPIIS